MTIFRRSVGRSLAKLLGFAKAAYSRESCPDVIPSARRPSRLCRACSRDLLGAPGSDPAPLRSVKTEDLRTFFRFSPSPCRGALRPHVGVIGFSCSFDLTCPSLTTGAFFCQLIGSISNKSIEDESNRNFVHLRIIPWRLGANKPAAFAGACADGARLGGVRGG